MNKRRINIPLLSPMSGSTVHVDIKQSGKTMPANSNSFFQILLFLFIYYGQSGSMTYSWGHLMLTATQKNKHFYKSGKLNAAWRSSRNKKEYPELWVMKWPVQILKKEVIARHNRLSKSKVKGEKRNDSSALLSPAEFKARQRRQRREQQCKSHYGQHGYFRAWFLSNRYRWREKKTPLKVLQVVHKETAV